jgi:hypothetical protein
MEKCQVSAYFPYHDSSCKYGNETYKRWRTYRYEPHNDVSANDGLYIRRRSYNIIQGGREVTVHRFVYNNNNYYYYYYYYLLFIVWVYGDFSATLYYNIITHTTVLQ